MEPQCTVIPNAEYVFEEEKPINFHLKIQLCTKTPSEKYWMHVLFELKYFNVCFFGVSSITIP